MIDVEIEEPLNKKMHSYDVLDDALYNITKLSVTSSQAISKANNNIKTKVSIVKSAEA